MLTLFLIIPQTKNHESPDMSVRVMSDHITDLTESVRIAFPAPEDERIVTGFRVLSLLTGQQADVTVDEQIIRPGKQLTWTVNFRTLDWNRG